MESEPGDDAIDTQYLPTFPGVMCKNRALRGWNVNLGKVSHLEFQKILSPHHLIKRHPPYGPGVLFADVVFQRAQFKLLGLLFYAIRPHHGRGRETKSSKSNLDFPAGDVVSPENPSRFLERAENSVLLHVLCITCTPSPGQA